MKQKSYYIIYAISIIILTIIWIKPEITNKYVLDELMTPETQIDNGVILKFEVEKKTLIQPEEKTSNTWLILVRFNQVLKLIIGAVNIFFLTKQIKEYLKKRKLRKNNDKKDH